MNKGWEYAIICSVRLMIHDRCIDVPRNVKIWNWSWSISNVEPYREVPPREKLFLVVSEVTSEKGKSRSKQSTGQPAKLARAGHSGTLTLSSGEILTSSAQSQKRFVTVSFPKKYSEELVFTRSDSFVEQGSHGVVESWAQVVPVCVTCATKIYVLTCRFCWPKGVSLWKRVTKYRRFVLTWNVTQLIFGIQKDILPLSLK